MKPSSLQRRFSGVRISAAMFTAGAILVSPARAQESAEDLAN